jgi:hypothetical protein
MNKVFILRQFLQNRNVKHWQYLFLASITSISSAIFWFYYSAIMEIDLTLVVLISALVQGFLAYIFMEEKGEARKVFFSLLFSLFSFFLGKYLFYEHYYDWFLNAYIDKTVINKELVVFYLSAINIESLQLFVTNISSVFSFMDMLWLSIIVLFSLLYLFLPFEEHVVTSQENPRKMFHKRRFD